MKKTVVTVAEKKGEQLRQVSLEAIAAARLIAGEEGRILSVILGDADESTLKALAQHGADEIIHVQHEALSTYTTDAYFQALKQVLEAQKPDAFVLGHTAMGKDLAPRLAARFQQGLITDCIGIEQVGDEIQYLRPIYAGKAFEKKTFLTEIHVVTIRPNNIPILSADEGRNVMVQQFEVEIHDLRTIVREVIQKATAGVDLAEAKIIVAGGRGVKSAEGFAPLRELADLLGGAVGASRGACDAEYCDYSLQIGQTGKVVTPTLYIACGISGAIQHLAGMSNSKVIVAINKDPEAPIFQVADYGIVGDLFEVVPLFTEELRSML